ncbi:MAG: ATP-binding protein [Gemmatimonadales bacterium]|nr:ATP-binding protein [Gemmatimonadales bacterium]NIN12211.1 ATP-binding protein [Gemmatimonadales bacterium]NIN50626.1 ATP-binding protein [Gemmatimonadales bacterium]NIP08090.1 ATP-binding protein [Gemmatimonadales bacterium]NIR03380.1 ATP-binding protein [Gemmatimonadales bacterium]
MTAPLRLFVRRRETTVPDAETRRVEIAVRVPTDLDVVEETVDLVARHCLASGVPPRAARFVVRVVLCEALANAIVYGNQLDPGKRVDVRVEVADDQLQLRVEDEGEGFDPGRVPDPTEPHRIECPEGRGLFLIRQLVDEVHFNDRGNSICMIMRRA